MTPAEKQQKIEELAKLYDLIEKAKASIGMPWFKDSDAQAYQTGAGMALIQVTDAMWAFRESLEEEQA